MGRRILLADDEPLVLEVLKAVLESKGYEVEAANSGAEAVRKLQEATFDLVITDLKMETETAGFAVSRMAKLQPYRPAVVVLTAYPPLGSDWQDKGADAIVIKSTATQEILRGIENLFSRD